ncbi:MAG: acyl-ACP--UDP-N-acetylglucosamine O-acyltransferase [Bacillota bacterium]
MEQHKEQELIAGSALISAEARVASDVAIGPGTIIGSGVVVEAGTVIEAEVEIQGRTHIGSNNHLARGALLGFPPQHAGYLGENTELTIGRDNYIGPRVTIHKGTSEGGSTIIGSGNHLAAFAHVAHDCLLGDGVKLGNNTQLAGHVEIGSDTIVGHRVGIHQFVRLGRGVEIVDFAKVIKDVPPFLRAEGHPAKIVGPGNCSRPELRLIMTKVYEYICHSGLNIGQAVKKIKSEFDGAEIVELAAFIESSSRGISR